jgi:murein DD-endopeptidase MepM/ murein hydrolase activator NlpD
MTFAKTGGSAGDDVSLRQRINDAGLRERFGTNVIRKVLDLFADDFDRLQAGGSNGSLEFMLADSPDDGCEGGRAGHPGQPDIVKPSQPNSLLEVAVTVGDKTRRLYGYDAGKGCEYFDGNGGSAKAVITRRPSWMSRLRIGFGLLRHPFLDAYKFHPGVDWIVADGGAVRSVGEGVVRSITSNAQTTAVTVQYRGSTEVTLGNLAMLAKGIEIGRTVRREQIIGYAAGSRFDHEPMVHYELLIDGRIVDPLNIELPSRKRLTGARLAAFQR